MSSEYGPDFDKFVERVRRELAPAVKDSHVVLSIVPVSPTKVDVKFAVELGFAIMYNKPILAVVRPGTPIPEKLAKVVDRFVELDFSDPNFRDRLIEVLDEMASQE